MPVKLSKEFLKKLRNIKAKRPRTVINHIIKHGHITTEELESKYGYAHAPRAARDVREQGVPLETFFVKNSSGRSIAAYKFGDLSQITKGKLGGRQAFSRDFKKSIINANSSKCCVCYDDFEERYLQIDHKIPYEVAGDDKSEERNLDDYMAICGSCNRAKSWSCEHCNNWLNEKSIEVCKKCYWFNPSSYEHIAMRQIRRLDVVWSNSETIDYDALKTIAFSFSDNLPVFVKKVLKKYLNNNY
jgi:hypothetical protein